MGGEVDERALWFLVSVICYFWCIVLRLVAFVLAFIRLVLPSLVHVSFSLMIVDGVILALFVV